MSKLLAWTKGYKTVTSILIIVIVAVLKYLNIVDEASSALIFEMAASLGLYGIYDKVRDNATDIAVK